MRQLQNFSTLHALSAKTQDNTSFHAFCSENGIQFQPNRGSAHTLQTSSTLALNINIHQAR
jgi:hypothetical protein